MAYLEYYSTVEEVIEDSGIQENDFPSVDTEEKLEAKVEKWLIAAKSYIDTDRDRDFSQELEDEVITSIPVCITDIAKRIALNMIRQARINADTPIVTRDDYTVYVANDSIMTSAIRKDLESCAPTAKITSNTLNFRCFNVNSETVEEIREAEEEEELT